jgi:hypothetical protein
VLFGQLNPLDQLDGLLALVSDGWRKAWEKLEGSYAGFLNDVGRAWRVAGSANAALANHGETGRYLGGEVRCALCCASVHSLASNIPPALLKEAVARGLWSERQVLAYARQTPHPQQRAEALAALAPHLPEALLHDALQTARAIGSADYKARALVELAPHLPEALLHDALQQAARAIGNESERSRAQSALAAQLDTNSLFSLYPLWAQALPILASRTRPDFLSDIRALLPVIVRLGGSQAATDIFLAIQDVGRWWP